MRVLVVEDEPYITEAIRDGRYVALTRKQLAVR